MDKNQYNPDYCTHPGEILLEHLICMGDEYYRIPIPIRENMLGVIARKLCIGRREANFFGRYTGRPAEFWLALQKQYEEWREKHGTR